MSKKIIGVTVGTTQRPSSKATGVYVGSGEMPDGYNVQIDPNGEAYYPTGVYVGSGEMPEGCNVQIDPNGEADDLSTKGLTTAQINALDGMFKKCAFTSDVTAEYEAFKTAFGIGETDKPEQPTTGIVQTGSVLAITSGVTATQSGSVLTIA